MKVRSPRSRVTTWRASSTSETRVGCLAAGAGAAADLPGEAVLLEFADELPDRGAGQAGEAGDLGAADRAEVVDGAQDEAGVVGARLGVGRLGRELGACHERDGVLLDVIDPLRRLRPHDAGLCPGS